MQPNQKTTFLTGATGFLGHFLLRELLRQGRRVVVLLRPPLADSVKRLTAMLAPLGCELQPLLDKGTLVAAEGVLPGSLPAPHWGRTDEILNCAASLQLFTNGTPDPFRTNVDGVLALVAWAREHDVRGIHAVSTAYVCGMNTGRIPESLHSPQPEFQTHYELSKWQSEWILAQWAEEAGHTLTIYRPSFVVGDSESGYTTQFGGFYQLARLVSMLRQQNGHHNGNGDDTYVPLRIPLHPEARHNVVPVDFAARLIVEGVLRPEFHGGVYHLADPDPPTNDFWKRCFEEAFHLHGGYFVDPRLSNGAQSDAEAMLWEQIDVLVPRLRHTPRFETSNMHRIARASGLPFPKLDRERILRLLDYAVRSSWGRRPAARQAGSPAKLARPAV